MSDEPEDKPDSSEKQPTVKIVVEKAGETIDKANTTMENTKHVMSTVKWVAIAVVSLVVFGAGYGIYKAISAPARAVGNAADSVTDAVKAGTEKVKDGTSEVINRLIVPVSDQNRVDTAAESAFGTLTEIDASEPEGMKDRLFRRKLGGHENKICSLSIDFGNGDIPVFIAADNEEYATAKALGAKDDRLIRMVIRLPDDDIIFNTEWDAEATAWELKWKATTVKKAIGDDAAEKRILDILSAVPKEC